MPLTELSQMDLNKENVDLNKDAKKEVVKETKTETKINPLKLSESEEPLLKVIKISKLKI